MHSPLSSPVGARARPAGSGAAFGGDYELQAVPPPGRDGAPAEVHSDYELHSEPRPDV